jgi:hypothetical protein
MNKSLFTDIKTRIETQCPNDIFHVDLWNNQLNKESTEKAFNYPAAFIDFSSLIYRSESAGVQKLDYEITIHCAFAQLDDSLLILDTVQKVVRSLHGWAPASSTNLSRTEENPDTDHDNVIDWQIVFKGTVSDCSTANAHKLKIIETPTTLEITSELDVDNPVIRSGDGD